MIVYYDASQQVDGYGKSKFYEMVREHIATIFEASKLEINGTDREVIALYQQFAFGYAIGAVTGSPEMFIDNFFEEINDPIGDWETATDSSGALLAKMGIPLKDIMGELIQVDGFAKEEFSEIMMPYTYGSAQQQLVARQAAYQIILDEMMTQTGLVGLMRQLFPGRYLNHYGEDFKGLILVCEHESLL